MEYQVNNAHFRKELSFPFYIHRVIHNISNVPRLHWHNYVELVYVVRGEAQHVFENTSYDIQAGDVFIINPGELHTYRVEEGLELEIINCLFSADLIEQSMLREIGISPSMDYFYVHPFMDRSERFHNLLNLRGHSAIRTLSLLEGMIEEIQNKCCGYKMLIRLQMVELLVLLSRYYGSRVPPTDGKNGRANERHLLVRRVCGYLERSYEKKQSVLEISELFNVSSRQLNRIFNEVVGMTVVDMIHKIRIEKAKHLLSETDEKIIMIAGIVGYDDPAFFGRLFLREVGCTPRKYRSSS